MTSHFHSPNRSRAFTLLEVTISMGVFVLLISGVFALVGATGELIEEVSILQDQEAVRLRLIETCRVNFEEMPADAELEFDFAKKGNNYNTYLSLVNAPNAFDFGFNTTEEIERVIFAAEIQPDGLIRAGLYYVSADEFQNAKEKDFSRINAPFVELVPRLRQVSWRFYDTASRVWRQTLEGNYRSSFVEMKLRLPEDTEPTTIVFWHPESQ